MSQEQKPKANNFFAETVTFIRGNAIIAYSMLLLMVIPGAFFAYSYYVNSAYESTIDSITQKKALLFNDTINTMVGGYLDDTARLQSALEKFSQVAQDDNEIVSLSILFRKAGQEGFYVAASSDRGAIGKDSDYNVQNSFAWSSPAEGVAVLDQDQSGRLWRLTKVLFDANNEKAGLAQVSFSLKDPDALINRVITNSYWVLAVMMLFIVLLIANQARFLGYAMIVTKIKEVDKMKDMFISMASHELRSPLTAIKGYLDLLKSKKDFVMDREAAHYFENISVSVQRLGALVEDILEVSRIEGNRLPMEIAVFDPAPVVSQCLEELRSQAIQKGLALNWKPLDAPVRISADESRFKQIIINLVSNAIKYTEAGTVDLSMAVKNGQLSIVVADTGIGMSSEDRGKLFQKFYRVKNDKTKNIIGTGLGLWITLEIARRMNGNITVDSIEGVGSHFTLRMPLAKS